MSAATHPPDRGQLDRFAATVFANADGAGVISLRAFLQSTAGPPVRIEAVAVGAADRADRIYRFACAAANYAEALVVCPPTATFNNSTKARTEDVTQGLVLSVECDANPLGAVKKLTEILGRPTMVVASGGLWLNPETGESEDKLHVYWVLARAVFEPLDLADLREARAVATHLVGADVSNISIVHPIRWPGTWNLKKTPADGADRGDE